MRIFSGAQAIIGNLNFVAGKWEYAKAWYKKATDGKTRKSVAYLNYAILVLREGDWQTAQTLLKRGLELKPNVINEKNMRLTLGTAHWVGGDVNGAIAVLEALRAKYDYVNDNVLVTLGYMYILSNRLEEAEEVTNLALKDAPESGAAMDNLGQIYYRRGDFAHAKEHFANAVQHHKNLPDSWYYLGIIAKQDGDFDSARDFFKKAADCEITSLNTVSRAMVEEELNL